MKKVPAVLSLALIVPLSVPLVLTGCGGDGKSGKDKILSDLGPKSKKLSEIKSKKSEMTPEQLKEARRKAGFKDTDEIAAENAKMFEKGAREYVKTRMKEYRSFLTDFRANIDEIEEQAAAWPKAKDPQKAFDKWRNEFGKDAKEIMKRYDKMTGRGAEGGNTQAVLGRAFRGWENLKNDLNAEIGANERFPRRPRGAPQDAHRGRQGPRRHRQGRDPRHQQVL